MPKLLCSWCEQYPLAVWSNGRGFYVGCAMSGETDCPTTTGDFTYRKDAVKEANEWAKEFWADRLPTELAEGEKRYAARPQEGGLLI